MSSKFSNLGNLTKPRAETKTESGTALSSTRKLAGSMIVPLEYLVPSPRQVRKYFDPTSLQELADDIKAHGILEPILVRTNSDQLYEIVAGERRFRAARLAGLSEVPVILKDMDDQTARSAMLAENIQRENLSPEEERDFFRQLQNEQNYSITKIAEMLHKSRKYVQQRIEGNLQSIRSSATETKNEDTAETSSDSAENHNLRTQHELIKKSQSDTVRKFKLSTLTKLARNIEDIETTDTAHLKRNPELREAVEASLSDIEAKIKRLRQKLLEEKTK